MDIFDMMKWLIAVVWGVAYVTQLLWVIKKPWHEYSWIKLGFGVLSAYWCFYYVQSSFFRIIEMNHQVWVRTPILLTGAFVAAAGIYTLSRSPK